MQQPEAGADVRPVSELESKPASASESVTTVAQAMAVPSRARLLHLLRRSDAPCTAAELASLVGQHVNTTRTHLEILVRAGLASRTTESPHGPGRPSVVYRAATGRAATSPDGTGGAATDLAMIVDGEVEGEGSAPEPYLELATLLVDELAANAEADRLANDAGRRWSGVSDRLQWPDEPHDPSQALARVVDLLQQLGFAPSTEPLGDRIYLHACPFATLARRSSTVVCGVHVGMLHAVLERLNTPLRISGVRPFVRENLCVVQLATSGETSPRPLSPDASPLSPG